MKRLAVLFLSVLLVLSVVPVAAATPSNLVQNGGFEDAVDLVPPPGWGIDPVTWAESPDPADYTVEVLTDNPRSGSNHVRVNITDTDEARKGVNLYQTLMGLNAGDKINVTAYVDVLAVDNAEVELYAEFRGSGGWVADYKQTASSVTSGYQHLTVDTVIPSGADALALFVFVRSTQAGGTITVDIDDVSVYATSSGQTVNLGATIIGGDLLIDTSDVLFGNVDIDYSKVQTVTGVSTLTVEDNRGTAEGWSISVSGTPLVSTTFVDPTSDGSGSFRVAIPVNAIQLGLSNLQSVTGQAVDPVKGPVATSSLVFSEVNQTLIQTNPGWGMGSYTSDLEYTVTVPPTVTVISKSGDGDINVGDVVGTLAGSYSGTITFTKASGI